MSNSIILTILILNRFFDMSKLKTESRIEICYIDEVAEKRVSSFISRIEIKYSMENEN